MRCLGRRHHLNALLLVVVKSLGADGLHLGDDEVGLMFGHNRIEGLSVEHGNDFVLVGHLHGGRTGIGVDGDDVLSEPLQGDDHFFAQFA